MGCVIVNRVSSTFVCPVLLLFFSFLFDFLFSVGSFMKTESSSVLCLAAVYPNAYSQNKIVFENNVCVCMSVFALEFLPAYCEVCDDYYCLCEWV